MNDLDLMVGTIIMDWTWIEVDGYWQTGGQHMPAGWSPSTDIAAAWQVVERMQSRGWWCQMRTPFGTGRLDDGYWCGFTPHGTSGWNGTPDHWTQAETLPRAGCLAALRAVGVEVSDD